MNPALQLFAMPAAGARIFGIERQFGARRAADAGIPLIIERERRNIMSFQVFPNFAIAPHCQRTYFLQLFSAGKFERFDELKVRPRWGLFAAKTGDPRVVGSEAFKQRRHFAKSTAAVRSESA